MMTASKINAHRELPQIKPEWLEAYSRVAIIGLGVSGFSVLNFLKVYELDLLVLDTREQESLEGQVLALTETCAANVEVSLGELFN